MTTDKHIETLSGRECVLFTAEDGKATLVQLVSPARMEAVDAEVAQIAAAAEVPFTLVAVPIEDWELELMPWPEPAVSCRPEVGSGAETTLRYLVDILPHPQSPVILGGYSLGGLFALWAACQTDRFDAVAAGSPSLWAGDWPQFAATHPMMAKHVYLSLGGAEERCRNKTIARIGDRIRNEYCRLQRQLGEENVTLVWEQGGHFADTADRMARAFVWTLKHLCL